MIQLTGLTRRQVDMLNTIWNIETMDEVNEYISSLNRVDSRDCKTLINLIELELLDQDINNTPDWHESRQVLEKFR